MACMSARMEHALRMRLLENSQERHIETLGETLAQVRWDMSLVNGALRSYARAHSLSTNNPEEG